ncbi:hypothetical protein I3843_09G061500 [Carya illinoinensis]|nr:hypothetical protein I3843_09G061500 [Carya illinoinensis]
MAVWIIQDGLESSFVCHGMVKQMANKPDMASTWQCHTVNDHLELVQTKKSFIIEAQISSIAVAPFYSRSKHSYNFLLTFLTLFKSEFKNP